MALKQCELASRDTAPLNLHLISCRWERTRTTDMLPQIWMPYKLVRSPIHSIVLKLTVTVFIPLKLKAGVFISKSHFLNH